MLFLPNMNNPFGGTAATEPVPTPKKGVSKEADLSDLYGVDGVYEETVAASVVSTILNSSILDPDSLLPLTSHSISPSNLNKRCKNSSEGKSQGMESPMTSPRLSKDDNEEAANLKDEIDKFLKNLKAFTDQYEQDEKDFDGIGQGLGHGLEIGEYGDKNEENVLFGLNKALPSSDYPNAEGGIKIVNRVFKWVDHTFPLLFNLYKLHFVLMRHNQFKNRLEDFKKLKAEMDSSSNSDSVTPSQPDSQMASLQTIMDKWNRLLKCQSQDLQDVIILKIIKLVSKLLSIPLEHLGADHKDASGMGKCFFRVVKSCLGISTVKRSLEIQREWKFHLQPQIHVNLSTDESEEPPFEEDSQTPPSRKVYYESVRAFLTAMQKCSNLQAVRQMLDNPNVSKSDEDILISLSLDTCTSLDQVQAKVRTQILFQEANDFLKTLEECASLEEVQEILDRRGIATIELPSTIERWQSQMKDQRFKRHLVQTYYSSVNEKPLMDASHIQNILKERAKDRKAKIERAATTVIFNNIQLCVSKDFSAIEDHFINLHIYFDRITLPDDIQEALPLPPKTKDEWQTCLTSPEFCLALAEQWVDHQTTIAQLIDQGARQAALSKIQVESKFLNFRWTECNVGIVSNILQAFFIWQRVTLKAAASILELFVTELAKFNMPGIGMVYLGYPLYPNLNFKLEGFIMLLAEHFFAVKYKPHEYSLEGYKLNMQIRLVELYRSMHYFISIFQHFLLWINVRLIENCIMGLKHSPFETDQRYIDYDATFEKVHMEYTDAITEYRKLLTELRKKDAILAVCPNLEKAKEILPDYNPLESLVETLETTADFEYFPAHILRSFQDNFGIDLAKIDKTKIKPQLEDFFIKSEGNLMATYQEHRFAYLRSGG